MSFALATPEVLWMLPLAALPLLGRIATPQDLPTVDDAPDDGASSIVDCIIRIVGAIAIAALILGAGGLHREGQTIEKLGKGSRIVLLIDRSASMDNSFAGRQPTGEEESKSAAARRLLKDFIETRPHDLVGVAAFSTSPMLILPLSDHKDAVRAAIDAMDRPGLAYTNVGRGLALAIDIHDSEPSEGSRAILLVSDGAAVIDRKVQEKLRSSLIKRPINLYWLFLRTAGSKGISDVPGKDEPDTPQALPERHLDKFFKSLGIPYRAFEAENPAAIADAIQEIDKLEQRPITYVERIPHSDLSQFAYGTALVALLLLVLAKLAEVPIVRRSEKLT